MCSAQSKEGGNNNRGDTTSLSPLIPDNNKWCSKEWRIQQRHSWDERFTPHWMLCVHINNNKGKTLAITKDKLSQYVHKFLQETSGLDSQTEHQVPSPKEKESLLITFKLENNSGHGIKKKQLHPRYTRNNIIDNMPTIPLDLLMDTFDLLSPSPVETKANGSREGLRKKWPKWNRTKVLYLQINPKHVRYCWLFKKGDVRGSQMNMNIELLSFKLWGNSYFFWGQQWKRIFG